MFAMAIFYAANPAFEQHGTVSRLTICCLHDEKSLAGVRGCGVCVFGGWGGGGAGDRRLVVLKAARMLDVRAGKVVSPGEVVVSGERIVSVGARGEPAGAEVIELGDVTLMPGMIDAHVHLFLHPGAEDLQTVQESVPERTLIAADAAKAGFDGGVYGGAGYGDGGCRAGGYGGAECDQLRG